MNRLRIAVCDDNKTEYDHIVEILNASGIAADCEYFSNGRDFLDHYFASCFDLVLLDIYMEGLSGIETAEELRRTDNTVPIAFITSSSDHAMDGYRLHIDRYLQKPLSEEPLKEICELAALRLAARPALLLKIDGKDTHLPYDSIIYIEQNGHSVCFHMISGDCPKRTGHLEDFISLLPEHFLHCHKSYLVNLKHVIALDIELNCFTMLGGEPAHIRRSSLKDAKQILLRDKRFLQVNRNALINMDHIVNFEKDSCELTGGSRFPVSSRDIHEVNRIRKKYIFEKLQNTFDHTKHGKEQTQI